MNTHAAPGADAELDLRWQSWQATGAEGDTRRATIMGRLAVVIAIGLAIALLVQLV